VTPCGACKQSERLVAFYEAQADRALAAQLRAEVAAAEHLERIRELEDIVDRLNRKIMQRKAS
jgi:hypothetical protein